MILLEGCVQPAMAPNINTATARVLDALGIEVVRPAGAGCCGAIRYHLSDHDGGLDDARRNIDAWWPLVEAGAEAIVMNASGCGQQVKEYGHLLARDPAVRRARAAHQRADEGRRGTAAVAGRRISGASSAPATTGKVVFHSPCTLQHGLKVRGAVEALLSSLGATVAPVGESHFCCGSAGTYSVLQPELSIELRDRRLGHLRGARTGCDPVGQHRLHHASAERHRDAGDALDRVAGCAAEPALIMHVRAPDELLALRNIGPAMRRDLELLGYAALAQLARRDPDARARTKVRAAPARASGTFAAAIRQRAARRQTA